MFSNITVACDAPRAAELSTVVFVASRRAIFTACRAQMNVPENSTIRIMESVAKIIILLPCSQCRNYMSTTVNSIQLADKLLVHINGLDFAVVGGKMYNRNVWLSGRSIPTFVSPVSVNLLRPFQNLYMTTDGGKIWKTIKEKVVKYKWWDTVWWISSHGWFSCEARGRLHNSLYRNMHLDSLLEKFFNAWNFYHHFYRQWLENRFVFSIGHWKTGTRSSMS